MSFRASFSANFAIRAGATLCATLFAAAAAAQTAFAPAVVVNDDIITYYDVDQRARLLQLNGAQAGPQLNAAALDQLIDDRLRSQAGKRVDLSASPEELTGAVDEFANRIGTDKATLQSRMKSLGVDQTALESFLSSQVVWRKLVNARFGGRATPTEMELDHEIELAASDTTRSYRISEIAIPVRPGQEAAATAEIERVVSTLRSGADFARFARRVSRAPSAQNGGDVGWVPETVLPPEIAEVIARTPAGGVTPPVQVPGGVAIYRVEDSREESSPWAKDATMSLRKVRIPIQGSGEEATAEAVARAEQIREETDGCGSMGDPGVGATTELIDQKLVSALPGPVGDAVRLLQAGQASEPIRDADGVDVYVVCSREGGVDDQARGQLREQIRTQRLTRLAEGYLQDLRREAVIERR